MATLPLIPAHYAPLGEWQVQPWLQYSLVAKRHRRWKRFHVDKWFFEVRFLTKGPPPSQFKMLLAAREVVEVVRESRFYRTSLHFRRGALLFQVLDDAADRVSKLVPRGRSKDDFVLHFSLVSPHLEYPVTGDSAVLTSDLPRTSLMDALWRLMQSRPNESIPFDESLRLHATLLDTRAFTRPRKSPARTVVVGAGRRSRKSSMRLTNWTLKALSYAVPAPEFGAADPRGLFADCCLLVCLVMGLARKDYLERMKEMTPYRRRSEPFHRYRLLRKGRPASATLRLLFKDACDVCRRLRVDPAAFRRCSLDENLGLLLEPFGVNVNIYEVAGGFKRVFSYPTVFDTELATINILLLEAEDEHKVSHAALIMNKMTFFQHKGKVDCQFCRHECSVGHFPVHVCSEMRRREIARCPSCRRRVLRERDYSSSDNLYEVCDSKPGVMPLFTCNVCGVAKCVGRRCLAGHKLLCKRKRGGYCPECGARYPAGGAGQHRCGESGYCRQCRQTYDGSLEDHVCHMARPSPNKIVSPLVAWDTETYVLPGSDTHRVNAVGASFEDEHFGVFSEVYFYDADMGMDSDTVDGVVEEHSFNYDYFPEGIIPPEFPVPSRKTAVAFEPPLGDGEDEEMGSDHGADRSGGEAWGRDVQVADGDSGDDDDEGAVADASWERDSVEVDDEDEGDPAPPGSVLDKFVWFFLESSRFANYTFVAHASSKFDTVLLLRVLLRRNYAVDPVMDGCKVLMLHLPALNVRFVDSHRYVAIALDKFPSRFPHLLEGQGKGFFPYRFNLPKNYAYRGTIPSVFSFVDRFTNSVKAAQAEDFVREWHASRRYGQVWDFREELHKYLKQDVALLRGGLVALTEEFLNFQLALRPCDDPSGRERPRRIFYPFSKPFFTGSSYLHAIWRYYAMPDDSVYLLRNQRNAIKTSTGEREWLLWLAQFRPGQIRSQFTDARGQQRLGNYHVDGYDAATRTVYEFNGCVAHGHLMEEPDCPLSGRFSEVQQGPFGLTLREAYVRWQKKQDYLEERGFRLYTMWECAFRDLRSEDLALSRFLGDLYAEGLLPRERLRIRDALRGGRTEPFHLLYDVADLEPGVADGQELLYIDKNSLYPHVAMLHEYPVGVPRTYIGESLGALDVEDYGVFRRSDGARLQGLLQCTILPPDSLFLPVLPLFCRGKLMYGLCRLCLEQANPEFCNHSDAERALLSTWTTLEVQFAISCGYRVLKLHEALLYERSEPLFRDFYSHLAQMKLESEGFPPGVDSRAERERYVADLNRRMKGLRLETSKVSSNPSRRNFAKFCESLSVSSRSFLSRRRFAQVPTPGWGSSRRTTSSPAPST